ncbi:MAG: hypothetical protein Ta2G_11530 [Termitinemataceae bacterium]|nr:MAG: hypothetical protein Ta2G_11530 [Termitinemataceae bacterium]
MKKPTEGQAKEGRTLNEGQALSTYLKMYEEKKIDERGFQGKVLEHLFDNYKSYSSQRCIKEDFIDFISEIYPRLSKAIFRYKDCGATFEGYIYSFLRFSFREYYFKNRERINAEIIFIRSKNSFIPYEDESVYAEEKKTEAAYNKINYKSKYALILLLKSYYHINDDFIYETAPKLGIKPEVLLKMVNQLRALRYNKDCKIKFLQDNISRQYFKCLVYENILQFYDANSRRYIHSQELLKRGNERLKNMRKRLARTRLDATNCQVAKILGLPLGTVDSILSKIKKSNAKFCILDFAEKKSYATKLNNLCQT